MEMTTGTTMLADAVFEVVSESIVANTHRRHQQPEAAVHRQQRGEPAAHRLGQPGLEREHPEREARRRRAAPRPSRSRAASFQVIAGPSLPGRTKSSEAPSSAATAFGEPRAISAW